MVVEVSSKLVVDKAEGSGGMVAFPTGVGSAPGGSVVLVGTGIAGVSMVGPLVATGGGARIELSTGAGGGGGPRGGIEVAGGGAGGGIEVRSVGAGGGGGPGGGIELALGEPGGGGGIVPYGVAGAPGAELERYRVVVKVRVPEVVMVLAITIPPPLAF